MTGTGSEAGIFILDAGLVVRTWDDWLVRATGVAVQDARGRPLRALFPDIEPRGLLSRLRRVVDEGSVEVLAPALHHYLLHCTPLAPSRYFDAMQQRVTIAPLRDNELIIGAIVTVEDVTERLERERDAERGGHRGPDTAGEDATRVGTAQALAGAIGDTNWQVRRAAAGALAQFGSPEALGRLVGMLREEYRDLSVLNSSLQALAMVGPDAVTPLGAMLDDPDAELRIYATLTLGMHRDEAALPFLLKALRDPDANVRYHAIEGLGRLRAPAAVEPLIAVAQEGDFYLSFPALDALAGIGDTSAAPRLVSLLANDLLRAPTVDALGRLGDENVVEPLVEILNRPGAPAPAVAQALLAVSERYERQYREGAYIADLTTCRIDEKGTTNLLSALDTAQPEELRALVSVLGWLKSPAVEQALARLLARPEVRRDVVEALVRHGQQVTELLIGQLDAEDSATRQAATVALGRIGDARAVPALTRLLTADPELTILAAGALAHIGDRRPFDALMGLMGDPDASVRIAVVSALNSLGHPDTAARVEPLMHSSDANVREAAVRVAGYFGFAECADALLGACRDPDELVRRAAVEHLPYLDDTRASPALGAALRDESPKVRAGAARALTHLPAANAVPLLLGALGDPDPWVRYATARSLGSHAAPESLGPLAHAARDDPATQVRIAALEALGATGGAHAVAILVPMMESADTNVATAALRALGQIAHPDALPPLVAALARPEAWARAVAARSLGYHGGDGGVPALQWAAAGDADPQVVEAAIEALGRLCTREAITALLALTADPSRREPSVLALAGCGKEEAGEVARGLEYPQPAVRQAAIDALAQMKRPEASALLIAALDHPDATVRAAACGALGRLGSREADRRLAALAHDDPDAAVRRAAAAALKRCQS